MLRSSSLLRSLTSSSSPSLLRCVTPSASSLSCSSVRSLSSSSSSSSSSSFTSEHAYGYNSVDHYFDADRLAPGSTSDPTNRARTYFINGTSAFLYASLARVLVVKFVSSTAASADVLAVSSLEVDLAPIAEGTSVTVKWRGKPVFIRHRNSKEIAAAKADDSLLASFRHPEKDAERVKDDKWMITLGICTHLGCVPLPNAGDYNGWFCPCHGSHYDTSGRIRKGPAPLNLEVPEYKFIAPTKIILG